MKTIGMARKVDDLGRIVLPVETRRMLGIAAGDELEIAVDGASIVLSKIETRCVFCSTTDDLREHRGKRVCTACARALMPATRPYSTIAPGDASGEGAPLTSA